MEGTEEKSILAIEVTETQREPIPHLFNHNDWNFMEVPVEESADQSESVDSDPDRIWGLCHSAEWRSWRVWTLPQ